MGVSLDFARYVEQHDAGAGSMEPAALRPSRDLLLWYRTSPRPLVPWGTENAVAGTNPPLTIAGMALDRRRRLRPAGRVSGRARSRCRPTTSPRAMDWRVLFSAAGLDIATFKPVEPAWVPPVFADERRAWEGPMPEHPDQTFRVEAAAMAAGRSPSR